MLIGLALAQVTLAGYIYIRAGYTQASCILLLPVCIYWYGYRNYTRWACRVFLSCCIGFGVVQRGEVLSVPVAYVVNESVLPALKG